MPRTPQTCDRSRAFEGSRPTATTTSCYSNRRTGIHTEAHAEAQAHDYWLYQVFTAQTLGLVEFFDGNRPAVRQFFTQSLLVSRRIGNSSGLAYAFLGLAATSADLDGAAALLGAADALFDQLGETLETARSGVAQPRPGAHTRDSRRRRPLTAVFARSNHPARRHHHARAQAVRITALALVHSRTPTGVVELVVVPVPNWPLLLSPQHLTVARERCCGCCVAKAYFL